MSVVKLPQSKAMRDTLLLAIHQEMLRDSEIFFVTADFGSPILDKIRADRPDRFINVGIAEQNLINVTAGLALEGYKVFAYAIAPFITMRCYEQIRINLALLSVVRAMNVNLIGVGAGYSYVVSGPTHQCFEDIIVMRALPNMSIYSPSDQVMAAALTDHCLKTIGPKYLRLDAEALPVLYTEAPRNFNDGFNILRKGNRICLIATGYMVHVALEVADKLSASGISVSVVDLFCLSDFSEDKMNSVLSSCKGVVTLEEGFRGRGGVDALIFDYILRSNIKIQTLNIGVKGEYCFDLGSRDILHEKAGIGPDSVMHSVEKFNHTLV